MGTWKHHRRRRGVVLLIILGMLAMFGMLALAFLLVTGNNKRSAQGLQRIEEQSESPPEQLHQAALQVLRGARSPVSPLRQHSLLEDMYGSSVEGFMVNGPELVNGGTGAGLGVYSVVDGTIGSGQLIAFTPTGRRRVYNSSPALYQYVPVPVGNLPAYVGRVLTMMDGWARGQSTRIVGYDLANNVLLILPFEDVSTAAFVADIPVTLPPHPAPPRYPNPGRRYVINGIPFAGTGFGYNSLYQTNPPNDPDAPTNAWLDDSMPALQIDYDPFLRKVPSPIGNPPYPPPTFQLQYALLPNRAGDPATADVHMRSSRANEDYDAVDYQNMLLAKMAPGGAVPIPSLHRPALINYWYNRLVNEWLVPATSDTPPGLGLTAVNAWRAVLQPEVAETLGIIDIDVRDAIIGIKRRISFRPLVEINGNFSGSNPQWRFWEEGWMVRPGPPPTPVNIFDASVTAAEIENLYWLQQSPLLNGPWDVDTDGDGVNDSIWVDLGMPLQTTADGRRYRPLFAILCVDMDGRINVNAAGCLAQSLQDSSGNALYSQDVPGAPFLFADESLAASLPRGQGVGPPEIDLGPVLDNNLAQYRNLLMGLDVDPDPNRIRWLDGRYGEALATLLDVNNDLLPDDPRDVAPGKSFRPSDDLRDNLQMLLAADPLSRNKHFELSALLSYATGAPTAFGTPPDFKGSMAIGLDPRGQPMYWPMIDPAVNTRVSPGGGNPDWWDRFAWPSTNDPYELNLSRNSARAVTTPASIDHAFSVDELERILRMYDSDAAGLADRLALLAPNLTNHRSEITTESWHVPTPAVAIMPNGVGGRITQLLANRGVPPLFWETLVPRELLAGLKMNLNRPIGNGRDDNGNGVVDEPGRVIRDPGNPALFILDPTVPSEIGEQLPVVDASGNSLPAVRFDHSNGVDVNGDGTPALPNYDADRAMSRQLQARHLFILAMLLRDAGYDVPVTPATLDATLNAAQQRELTVRRIAQWAVNMVDFRDADAIMTPFEYDVNPFTIDAGSTIPGTWNVDGVIDTAPTVAGSDDGAAWRRLVWGCEAPELTLGEVTAFHDRRLVDSANDISRKTRNNGNPNDDPDDDDLDSARIPQGSAFFELYCTGNPNNAVAPGSLYARDPSTGIQYLDLGRMAPADATSGLAYPVWRMAISESAAPSSTNSAQYTDQGTILKTNSVLTRLANRPDSTSLEPEQSATIPGSGTDSEFSLINGVNTTIAPNVEIDRIVWFAAQQPTTHDDANLIYYGRNSTTPLLRPGDYAVVGPRPVTVIGSYRNGATVNGNIIDQYGSPSPHMVQLWPQVDIVDNGTGGLPTYPYPTGGTEIQPSLGIVVAADPPAGWTNTNNTARFGIGISVSEPLPNAYYPEPRANNVGLANFLSNLAPAPFPGPYETWDAYGDLTETNLDINNDGIPDFYDRPQDSVAGRPLANDVDGLLGTGTTVDYRTVFLQRLADPMQPYDRERNPYLTVDWSPVDLTVFNSDDYSTALGFAGGPWDPDDPNPQDPEFETRQWGRTADWSLWAREPADSLAPTDPSTPPAVPAYSGGLSPLIFRPNLVHTLGYLNVQFHDATVLAGPYNSTQPWFTAAYTPAVPAGYYGAPTRPFPWLAWNNRPYVNEMELLQVPASHPARLLHDFRLALPTDDPYTNVTDPLPATKTSFLPFGHLPNFLSSDATPGNSPHLYRVLEYLHVPSRFVGTETIFNPASFSDYTDPNTRRFRPPFNRVSQYREPGRVNLNTIFSPNVWTGVTSGFTDFAAAYWSDMVGSRQGYPGTNLNPLSPTQFARPFRSFAGSYLVPLPDLRTIHGPPPGGEEIQATLLREDTTNVTPPQPREPLFRHESITNPDSDVENTDRNPYFRYQFLQKLAGVTTTRSNVYAVWITAGYFEVELAPGLPLGWTPDQYQAVYPGGYRLGQELGSDMGEIKRHRAFYLFDRSIPVGFERGRDVNVKKAILLERLIE